MSSYHEMLKFDPLTEEFYVERCVNFGTKAETYERKPISEWGLTKKVEVSAHVTRRIESPQFEAPFKMVNYELPLTYEIEDIENGKYVYLKTVSQGFDIPKRDNPRANWIKIMLRDIDSGICQPLPNFNNQDFPFLKITKGIARELTRKEVFELWKSGRCLGTFDFKLDNRII